VITMTAQLAGNKALAQLDAVRKAWREAMVAEANDIRKEYEKTVATWSHRVTFVTAVRPTQTGITAETAGSTGSCTSR